MDRKGDDTSQHSPAGSAGPSRPLRVVTHTEHDLDQQDPSYAGGWGPNSAKTASPSARTAIRRSAHPIDHAAPPPPYTLDPPDLRTDTTTARYVASNLQRRPLPSIPVSGVPRMNIVMFIVGSRGEFETNVLFWWSSLMSSGDVQPYIALALTLITEHGHRVRIATHPNFKNLVLSARDRLREQSDAARGETMEEDLEFFDAGGDPKSLMDFMVKSESTSENPTAPSRSLKA